MSKEEHSKSKTLEQRVTEHLQDLDERMKDEMELSADRCHSWALTALRNKPMGRIEHKIRTKLESSIEHAMMMKVEQALKDFEANLKK